MKFNTVLNHLGIRVVDSKSDFGIEIEVEGENLQPLETGYWTTTRDGSLRGESYEYISNGPQKFKDFPDIYKELMQHFRHSESKPNMSFRTSVHVHLNVNQLNINEIQTLVYLYLLYEEDLLRFSGEERYGNRFCLSIRDADGALHLIKDILQSDGRSLPKIRADQMRYASVNIASLIKFGTLEFRSMRGTLDYKTLQTWLDILESLKKAAIKFGCTKNVFEFLKKNGVAALTESIFTQEIQNEISRPESIDDVQYNASLLIEFPFVFRELEKEKQIGPFDEAPMPMVPAPVADGAVRRPNPFQVNWNGVQAAGVGIGEGVFLRAEEDMRLNAPRIINGLLNPNH